MQYDHKKIYIYFTYCDNHAHQLKTTITYTKKKTFIGPVHHTHRNISNMNFYRASTSHTHRKISKINFYRGSTSYTHTQKFPTKSFLGLYITHTVTFPNKKFHRASTSHTHRNISNKNFYRASTSHTEKHFQHKLL